MNRRRLARGIGVIGLAAIAACSAGGSGAGVGGAYNAGDGGASTGLRDEYEAVGTVPLNGGITEITFGDTAQTYSLKRLNGASAPELISFESGTYALAADGSTITLTPTGKAPQTFPFQVTTSSLRGPGLHLTGLGDILNEIVSFLFNGQTFQNDDSSSSASTGGSGGGGGGTTSPGTGAGTGGGGTGTGAGGGGGAGAGTGTGTGSSGPTCRAADAGAPRMGTGNGVDVSHYQGTIDWTKVHATKNFAYAKATEGTSYTDSKFSTYWAGMESAGIPRGAYHFFRASKDGKAQADYFANALLNHGFSAGTDLPPMLDLEVTDGVSASTVITQARAFLTEAQAKLGVTLILYTGPSFWTSTLGNPDFSSQPLWIAQYTTAKHPKVPSHWSDYTIWQFSQSIPVNGIGSAGVDNDRWQGATSPDASTMSSMPVCTPDAGAADATVSDGSGPDSALEDGNVDGSIGPDAGFIDGSLPEAGLIPGTCTHDVCTAGTALGQACNSCTLQICAVDPYCCDTYWGASCFTDVMKYCGMTCPP
jgi:lysozyme